MAKIIDGKIISSEIKREIKEEIIKHFFPQGIKPGLATVLVGNNPASEIYVNSKFKACQEIGMKSEIIRLSADISQEKLIDTIKRLNFDDTFHGILVQQPLPKQINLKLINESILPSKDVDGFNPFNMGNLLAGEDSLRPCTPAGIQELLKRYNIQTDGKHVVIIGRSNIVGKPMMAIIIQKEMWANSTVTVCHSATKNIKNYTLQADILIAAIGKAEFVTADMVSEGAVVIDVGINRVSVPDSPKGYKLVGDVKYDEVEKIASYITPVPGGVGPLTIAMLLKNTLKSAKDFYKLIY